MQKVIKHSLYQSTLRRNLHTSWEFEHKWGMLFIGIAVERYQYRREAEAVLVWNYANTASGRCL